MDFIDQIKQFSKRALSVKGNLETEEATKTALIMPFFSMLGYDVFNPTEFTPEFTADRGIKKGEKVDYAIINEGKPVILIEAKSVNEPLGKHDSQLFRYFSTTNVSFGILTNGIIYKFYSDLDTPNKMDLKPFLEIDILDIKESQVAELKKFHKSNFDLEEVINTASELKYSNAFERIFKDELDDPSDEFIRFFLNDTYDGVKTQSVLDRFKPVLKKTLNNFVSELMNEKIKIALKPSESAVVEVPENEDEDTSEDRKTSSGIVTTHGEIEAYAMVRNILKDIVNPSDIYHRDTKSYFGILYQDNNRKWICRFKISDTRIQMIYPDEEKNDIIVDLESLYDIETYGEKLIEVVNRYIEE